MNSVTLYAPCEDHFTTPLPPLYINSYGFSQDADDDTELQYIHRMHCNLDICNLYNHLFDNQNHMYRVVGCLEGCAVCGTTTSNCLYKITEDTRDGEKAQKIKTLLEKYDRIGLGDRRRGYGANVAHLTPLIHEILNNPLYGTRFTIADTPPAAGGAATVESTAPTKITRNIRNFYTDSYGNFTGIITDRCGQGLGGYNSLVHYANNSVGYYTRNACRFMKVPADEPNRYSGVSNAPNSSVDAALVYHSRNKGFAFLDSNAPTDDAQATANDLEPGVGYIQHRLPPRLACWYPNCKKAARM
uniref:Alpha-factor-transporting ATPase n=1 Tax=Lygus hesperus TaxID=30085 RepID=A0A0A9YNM5_LYGHE